MGQAFEPVLYFPGKIKRVRVKVRGGEQWYEGLLEIVDERFGYLLIPDKDGFWDLKLVELMSPSWGDLIIEEPGEPGQI
ncbi:MAG: hypothetical protein QW687_00510 [Candidatus Hadarchaeales archaeon]